MVLPTRGMGSISAGTSSGPSSAISGSHGLVQAQPGEAGLGESWEVLASQILEGALAPEGLGAMISGDLDGGEQRLRGLIERYPDDKEARLTLASVKRGREGSGPEVARLIEETLRLDPLYTIGYNELAYTESGRGNHDSALALIDTYVRLEPGEPNPLDSRGELLARAGREEEARQSFHEALVLDPSFTLALRHLLASHLRASDVPGALAAMDPFTRSADPRVRMIARALEAEARFWAGDFEAGLAALEASVNDPRPHAGQQVNSLRSHLFALLQLGRYEEALALGPRMVEIAPLEGAEGLVEIVAAGERGDIRELSSASDRMVERFNVDANLDFLLPVAINMGEIWKAFYRGEHERVVELAASAPFARDDTGTEQLGYPVMRSLLALGRGEEALSHVDVARSAGITGVPGTWDSLTRRILQYYEGRARELTGDTAGAAAAYRELVDGWGDAVSEVPLVADAAQRLAALEG